jgi:hypothetical protein
MPLRSRRCHRNLDPTAVVGSRRGWHSRGLGSAVRWSSQVVACGLCLGLVAFSPNSRTEWPSVRTPGLVERRRGLNGMDEADVTGVLGAPTLRSAGRSRNGQSAPFRRAPGSAGIGTARSVHSRHCCSSVVLEVEGFNAVDDEVGWVLAPVLYVEHLFEVCGTDEQDELPFLAEDRVASAVWPWPWVACCST